MSVSSTKLSQLVASRICHDLVSPVGAMANGMELLALSGGTPDDMQLIGDSLKNALGRLRFLRIAFGLSSGAQPIGSEDINRALEGLRRDRLHIEWRAEGAIERSDLRSVFLALLCLEKTLPLGRSLAVERKNQWEIRALGDRLQIKDELWAMLSNAPETEDDVTPDAVPFLLLADALRAAGTEADIRIEDTRISVSF